MTMQSGTNNQPTDATLLEQVASGNLDALEQLFGRYQSQVRNLAQGITRDAETAEEIVQDVFYRLYSNASRLDGSVPLLPWLYRVAANLSYNHARRRWRWLEPLTSIRERLFAPSLRSPEHLAEQRELQTIVRRMLDELAPIHRAVLTLYYLNDHSIPEIATMLDLPEGTVKSRLHHARKILKERLLRRYGETGGLLDQV